MLSSGDDRLCVSVLALRESRFIVGECYAAPRRSDLWSGGVAGHGGATDPIPHACRIHRRRWSATAYRSTDMIARVLALLAGAVLLVSSSSGSTPSTGAPFAPAKDSVVSIRTFGYRPPMLEVRAGARVRWVNLDDIEHTVTSGTPERRDARFAGTLATKDATFATTFSEPGTFPYFCDRHQFMRGEIHVTP
jgi:plastocyanin